MNPSASTAALAAPRARWARAAAAFAVVLAVVLALVRAADSAAPAPENSAGAPPVAPELLAAVRAVEEGADHVDPAELAALLLDDPGRLSILDFQTPQEFALLHLPGAVNLTLPELLEEGGLSLVKEAAAQGRTVVLVSRGMTHAAQAWMALAALGLAAPARVLEDGMSGFRDAVLAPASLRDPALPPVDAVQAARYDQLRRESLGVPAAAAPSSFTSDPAELAAPAVVSTAWLARNLGRVVVLDGRAKAEAFAAGHVPGARHLGIDELRRKQDGGVEELLPAAELAGVYGALGIDADTPVVAYAGDRLHDATHVLIGLLRLGHRRMAVLDGGYERWVAEGRPSAAGAEPPPAARDYPPRAAEDFTAELEDVARAQRDGGARILDVRPLEQFRGEPGSEARAGHVPGSLHRAIAEDLMAGAAGTTWKGEETLRGAYDALGIGGQEPVIVSCRTGHQASLTYYTLRWLLGNENARWYDGSWQEWAAHPELPLAVGEPR